MLPGSLSMIHYHVFWTRPLVARTGSSSSLDLVDFEALTWIAGALEIRRHSPIHLITDSLGAAFFVNSGLGWIYDEISTDLDDIPAAVHPAIFWDGGKMFAFQRVRTPCVIVDYDAILWRPIEPTAPVMALHDESREWSFYVHNRRQFARFGFEDASWDWEVNPVNTALVYFSDDRLPRYQAEQSVRFMQAYSAAQAADPDPDLPASALYNRATLFAGQRLLALCARQLGLEVGLVARLAADGLTLARNPYLSHLWLSKALYRCCPEARAAYVNHLIGHLRQNHPESLGTLNDLGLDEPREPDPEDSLDLTRLGRTDARRRRLRRFRSVRGEVRVEDANVRVFRPAREGMLLLPGETVHTGTDGHYELEPAEPSLIHEQ